MDPNAHRETAVRLAGVLRRNLLIAVVVLAATFAAACVFCLVQPRSYESTAKLYVATSQASSTTDLVQGASYIQQVVGSYADIATTPYVLRSVIDGLSLPLTTDQLAREVEVTVPVGQSILAITVTDRSPARAAAIAGGIADRLMSAVGELNPASDEQDSELKVTEVQQAVAPDRPSSPNIPLDLVLGVVLGLLLAGAAVAAREVLDTRVRTAAEVEQLSGLPVLARTLEAPRSAGAAAVVRRGGQSAEAEAYRTLRSSLRFVATDEPLRSVVVTSSVAGEGKSVLSCNLAEALAEAGDRVVLVDTDLRRPSVAGYLGLPDGLGLSDVLIGACALDDALQPAGDQGLQVLTAGSRPPNPGRLLESASMAALVAELEQRFAVVLLDAPPLLPVADAAVLARSADGVLVVAATGIVRRPQLRTAVAGLQRTGAEVLGAVAARLPRTGGEAYEYGRDARSATS